MKTPNRLPMVVVFIFAACLGDADAPPKTATDIQTEKLTGIWVPGTVIHEIDGDITEERFSSFSIEFIVVGGGHAVGGGRLSGLIGSYKIINPSGEAFEVGEKRFDYVSGNVNRIIRLDNSFQFDIALSNRDTELQITVEVDESGSPLGRILDTTTGRYTFNLVKL